LKLLPEAEGEELPDEDDDDTELPEGVVDPVALALETEPDVDSPDDVDDPELVVVTVAPTANPPLEPMT
jgi:hypothetical protein